MSKMNRMANCKNHFQGESKKVLTVCSAGLLRSPSAAIVLASKPFNFNTRAAGISEEYALIPVDDVLLYWADEIVCMEKKHEERLNSILAHMNMIKKVICLEIEDDYAYRDPELMRLIKSRYLSLQELSN